MSDVTHLFNTYRECVRHLWNTYFRPIAEASQDWDVHEEFDTIARELFSSLVLRPLSIFDRELASECAREPIVLRGFQVVPAIEHGTPICVNRDIPRGGYWDHPVSRVRRDDVELRLLRFFDFDMLGHREYRYFEVAVAASATYPDIVGRVALIEVGHAKVLLTAA
jgi:hypothetical protein